MKILVTGGSGFIGSHIVDKYIKRGHNVTVIDNLSTGDIKNLNPEAKFYKEDICSNEIEKIIAHEHFDVINHHAAQINVRVSMDEPFFDAQVNVMGSLHLLILAIKYKIKRFIFASSGGTVYGEPLRFPITESYPINPSSPYGVSKAAFESYLSILAGQHDMDYVILRYSNVYGPRQISKSEAGVISIFINQILNHKKCIVFGDGEQTRDYIYVDDVVRANVAALECPSNALNVGTGIESSVNKLITILAHITSQDIDHEHAAARPGEVSRNVLDISKIISSIGWRPEMAIKQGIRKTFDYFKEIS